MVPGRGLEPPRLIQAQDPKSCVSAIPPPWQNSTLWQLFNCHQYYNNFTSLRGVPARRI